MKKANGEALHCIQAKEYSMHGIFTFSLSQSIAYCVSIKKWSQWMRVTTTVVSSPFVPQTNMLYQITKCPINDHRPVRQMNKLPNQIELSHPSLGMLCVHVTGWVCAHINLCICMYCPVSTSEKFSIHYNNQIGAGAINKCIFVMCC